MAVSVGCSDGMRTEYMGDLLSPLVNRAILLWYIWRMSI